MQLIRPFHRGGLAVGADDVFLHGDDLAAALVGFQVDGGGYLFDGDGALAGVAVVGGFAAVELGGEGLAGGRGHAEGVAIGLVGDEAAVVGGGFHFGQLP